jgi:hypothetical protein
MHPYTICIDPCHGGGGRKKPGNKEVRPFWHRTKMVEDTLYSYCGMPSPLAMKVLPGAILSCLSPLLVATMLLLAESTTTSSPVGCTIIEKRSLVAVLSTEGTHMESRSRHRLLLLLLLLHTPASIPCDADTTTAPTTNKVNTESLCS